MDLIISSYRVSLNIDHKKDLVYISINQREIQLYCYIVKTICTPDVSGKLISES